MKEIERPISIVRHQSDDPFVRLPRATAQDSALGWRPLGMLTYMLSLPSDWKFFLSELAGRRSGHGNGRAATTASLGELQLAGYLLIERVREGGRIVGTRWHVADRPIFLQKQGDSPQVDFLNEENQSSENQRVQSKQETKKTVHKKAAARAPARAAAGAAAHGRRRKGDEEVRHGVAIWTPGDWEGLMKHVELHGVAKVEKIAATLQPAPGHRAPFLSMVVSALAEADARAARDARAAPPSPLPPKPSPTRAAAGLAAAKAALQGRAAA